MLNIHRMVCNPYQENTYVVSDDTGECVVIDCGVFFEDERMAILDYINSNDLLPRHLLCTHAHFDHCAGNDTIYECYGLKPEIGQRDELLLKAMPRQFSDFLGMSFEGELPPVGRFLVDGDVVKFGTHRLQVVATPGHTPGGVTFYCQEERVAFTGDTLFQMSIGRTDLAGGDYGVMMKTLKEVIAALPDETEIYAGHGPKTTIGSERAMNPYLR